MRVEGLGFRDQGLGFGDEGLGFREGVQREAPKRPVGGFRV